MPDAQLLDFAWSRRNGRGGVYRRTVERPRDDESPRDDDDEPPRDDG